MSTEHLYRSAEAPGLDATDLTPATRLKRDPSTTVQLRTTDASKVKLDVTVGLGAGPTAGLALPEALRPALEWMAGRKSAFTFGELCEAFPNWNSSALASVAAFMVRTKALVELPFEPLT
ncbi:MAG: hypothetical protein U0235_17020 [Polyangiaceae bacterium]